MIAFTGPDALRFELSGTEVQHLHFIGTIPGVIPLLPSASNGPGLGWLSSSGDGKWLHWRAPESVTHGVGVRCAADASYLLRDGEDRNKWIRVQVDASELAAGGRDAVVELVDRYNNAISNDDVTASEAASGDVETYTFTLVNQSNTILSQLRAWIAPGVPSLEISDDGAAWVSPTAKETALELPDLLVSGSDTLHIRRTIAAGAILNIGILSHLNFSWRG